MTTTLALKVKPKQFRFLFLGILLLGSALIWGAYFSSITFAQKNAEQALKARVQALVLILEDHVSRSLDAVNARLKSVAAVTTSRMKSDARLSQASLLSMIFNDNIVRSISLVDDQGLVVASSSAKNIGVVLPSNMLNPPGPTSLGSEVRFGSVLPYRDLNEIGRSPVSSSVTIWLASLPVQIEGKRYQWIAALNPGVFHNLWARVDRDQAIGTLLVNYQGMPIVSQNGAWSDKLALTEEITRHVSEKDRGSFNFSHAGDVLEIAYRASNTQPVILAVVGDIEKSFAQLSSQLHYFFIAALTAFLALVAVVGILYRGYLRYERSLIEMTNQAKAITAHLMVSESTPEGKIMSVNQAFQDISGFTSQELIGQRYNVLSSRFHPPGFYKMLWDTIRDGKIWKGVFRNQDRAGRYFWVNATIIPFADAWGRNTKYVAFYSDITQAIHFAEALDTEKSLRQTLTKVNQQLISDVNTDALTQIPNRRAFDIFIQEALISTKKFNQKISLLMIDIDHFKSINDTYGHATGDLVLQEVASRWSGLLRASDMVARIGGEEFCIVLPQTSELSARRIANKVLKRISETPVDISRISGAGPLNVTVSIGLINIGLDNDLSIQTILGFADEALYAAKGLGRNRITVYEN